MSGSGFVRFLAGILANGRDVSERMAAEQAVLASEARYRTIAQTAQEGIWVVDLAQVYPEGNPDNTLLLLEITENALMANPEAARRTLERLQARGVGSAIDDFGTGYSSLAYLSKLPVQAIKLDRSFVTNLAHDEQAQAIATAITDLARALRMRTVAEGVETTEQLAVLRRLGCTSAQGWLWTKALPLDEVIALVESLPGQRFPVD